MPGTPKFVAGRSATAWRTASAVDDKLVTGYLLTEKGPPPPPKKKKKKKKRQNPSPGGRSSRARPRERGHRPPWEDDHPTFLYSSHVEIATEVTQTSEHLNIPRSFSTKI